MEMVTFVRNSNRVMTDAERKAEECRLGQKEPPEKESNRSDARQTSRRNENGQIEKSKYYEVKMLTQLRK